MSEPLNAGDLTYSNSNFITYPDHEAVDQLQGQNPDDIVAALSNPRRISVNKQLDHQVKRFFDPEAMSKAMEGVEHVRQVFPDVNDLTEIKYNMPFALATLGDMVKPVFNTGFDPLQAGSQRDLQEGFIAELEERIKQKNSYNALNRLIDGAEEIAEVPSYITAYGQVAADSKKFTWPGGNYTKPVRFLNNALYKMISINQKPKIQNGPQLAYSSEQITNMFVEATAPVLTDLSKSTMTMFPNAHIEFRKALTTYAYLRTPEDMERRRAIYNGLRAKETPGFELLFEEHLVGRGTKSDASNAIDVKKRDSDWGIRFDREKLTKSLGKKLKGDQKLHEARLIIFDTLLTLAEDGDEYAGKIVEAYNKFGEMNATGGKVMPPFPSVIKLSNLLLPANNKVVVGDKEVPFEKLDERVLSNIPEAFRHILHTIDPELLTEAREDDSDSLAIGLRMHVVDQLVAEGLEQNQQDKVRNVGDYVLFLFEEGKTDEEIRDLIDAREHDKGDTKATDEFGKLLRETPDVNPSKAKFNRTKPGYGKIS